MVLEQESVRALTEARATEADFLVARDGTEVRIVSSLDELCGYPAQVLPVSDLNAYADGSRIYVTSSMRRFADDLRRAL